MSIAEIAGVVVAGVVLASVVCWVAIALATRVVRRDRDGTRADGTTSRWR